MQCLLAGRCPSSRHDGSAWKKSDKARKNLASQEIAVRGAIVEVRADWQCLKSVFRFPGWQETTGCCYRCNIVPREVADCDSSASWRKADRRHSHWTLLQKMQQEGQGISTLFSCPYLTTMQFAIDWLHACDLGVGQDFLGNFFWYILRKFPAANSKLRIRALFLRLRAFYDRTNATSRLDNLSSTMIRKTAQSCPKLRSKAAEARCLIPLAQELAEELLNTADSFEATLLQCCREINTCYNMLSRAKFKPQILQAASTKFCILYKALGVAAGDPNLWRLKPKFHIWLEACMEGSCPSTMWTYRDEDFGGSVASLARCRGGPKSAGLTAQTVLVKFISRHNVPVLG